MGSIHRAAKLTLGVAAGLALTLSGTAVPASAATTAATKASTAEATATWTLLDINSPVCVTSDFGHPGMYFGVVVVGTWSRPLRAGVRNLPPGSVSRGTAPIPPGSNHGTLETGVRVVTLVSAPIRPAPVGVYNAELWVSDGIETQAVPAPIHVKERCY